jgi:hypothetical protein
MSSSTTPTYGPSATVREDLTMRREALRRGWESLMKIEMTDRRYGMLLRVVEMLMRRIWALEEELGLAWVHKLDTLRPELEDWMQDLTE